MLRDMAEDMRHVRRLKWLTLPAQQMAPSLEPVLRVHARLTALTSPAKAGKKRVTNVPGQDTHTRRKGFGANDVNTGECNMAMHCLVNMWILSMDRKGPLLA